MTERPELHFGPPQNYEEALLRFPSNFPSFKDLTKFRKLFYTPYLEERRLEDRMVRLSPEVIKLMERWSFRRDLTSTRSMYIGGTLERLREVEAWKLKPQAKDNRFTLTCIRVHPGFTSDKAEYLLGFLTTGEYDDLISTENLPLFRILTRRNASRRPL